MYCGTWTVKQRNLNFRNSYVAYLHANNKSAATRTCLVTIYISKKEEVLKIGDLTLSQPQLVGYCLENLNRQVKKEYL